MPACRQPSARTEEAIDAEVALFVLRIIVNVDNGESTVVFQDELIKGLSNKQPKIVAGCVQVLRTALR